MNTPSATAATHTLHHTTLSGRTPAPVGVSSRRQASKGMLLLACFLLGICTAMAVIAMIGW